MIPILPLLILGGGAALLVVSRKKSTVVTGDSCPVVSATQAQVDAKFAAIMQWVTSWRDKPNAKAIDCMTSFMRTLFPTCTWPPPSGERQIRGADGSMHSWSELVATFGDKTVAQAEAEGLLKFGAMSSVDATGLSTSQGPGIKGIT